MGYLIFDLFGSFELDVDPMTFNYKRDPYPLEIYIGCAITNFLCQGFRELSYYRRTVCPENRD